MATTKNTNLFYLLYSNDKSVADSGYVCTGAVDETETSFSISGSEAVITDSNGDELASVDLSSIDAANITQYNVETKILQPLSAYLLQGDEFGETYKQQYFVISKYISSLTDYDSYCDIKFDLLYRQKKTKKVHDIHIDTAPKRSTYGSFTILAQNQLNSLLVPISISIRTEDDTESSNSQIDYVNFSGTEEGYDFIVRNVILTPLTTDAENCEGEEGEFYDSPFTPAEVTQDLILDMLNKYKPALIGKSSDDSTYKINCDIYQELLRISPDMTADFNLFVYEIETLKSLFLPCFETDGTLIFTKKFKEVVAVKYNAIYEKYFNTVFSKYNINDLYNVLNGIKDYIFTIKNTLGPNACYENVNKRVNNMKYTNGAMRGIVIIPDWSNSDALDGCTLWANHVADKLEICVPVDIEMLNKYYGGNLVANKTTKLYEKAIASVKINALIPLEREQYIEDYDNLPLNDISSNDGFTNSFDDLWQAGYDDYNYINNNYHRVPVHQAKTNILKNDIEYFDPTYYIDVNKDDEDIWENNPNKANVLFVDSHDNSVNNSIGLYKYMDYLSNNDLWMKIGTCYISVAKDDDFSSTDRNLLQSMLLYNPNDVPIRVKYIIFS